jgi:two-component system CheB/CheR fusion protein
MRDNHASAAVVRAASERKFMPSRHPRKVNARGEEHFLIVAIGASAGGLEACRKFLDALPAVTGMAFILIQHLDPHHESMLVDLLTRHTAMTVLQVTEGLRIEPEHLYVIPPGSYLSISDGALHLSPPQAAHGARMPFDFLLHSMASQVGARSVCVILSGTGADGSLGLRAVKDKAGWVIAQDPAEAAYDGMPRSAIATGAVDRVIGVAGIPKALAEFDHRLEITKPDRHQELSDSSPDVLQQIIDLLRTKTTHDFRLYKKGTLQRRIDRRMALSAIKIDDMEAYLALLNTNATELNLLAKDLLINVTSFFRDPTVFDFLAKEVIPELIRGRGSEQPIRIWVAGCSTGEETYSLAMLFREAITAAKSDVKLQFFASDVDADAVANARDGIYPKTIAADVSPARLARFFSKEEHRYRISSELRAVVVFTVQDVLADPPFSRLDMISCRNLMIYLGPEAQTEIVSVFHLALRERGILVLGSSETIGTEEGRFEVISKSERVFRNLDRGRSGNLKFSFGSADTARVPIRVGTSKLSPEGAIAELCRRLVIEHFAPAAVLINRKQECLFTLGPTDRYLRVAPGIASNDFLSMAPQGIRTKLRSAIQQAGREHAQIVVAGGRMTTNGATISFSVKVQPVQNEGEELFLICFVDDLKQEQKQAGSIDAKDIPRVAELELELAATRTDLQGAIRNLEISSEEQTTINEEALSVNEEFQSTNEELLTSKEELQSLNEELTALNSQLQETLERQRTTSNDLQNVLYSTDVATLFLDTDFNIRFFTPATKLLFRIIPSDVGRPLADFNSLAADNTLLADARTILRTLKPLEREIKAQSGAWYIRRMLPYRTLDHEVEGIVITFTDVTERKEIAKALEAAKQQADRANLAKSRFLAAASHDLRQPLQTLALVQGLLAKRIEDEPTKKLVALQDQTLAAMSGMLNTLLDINQIDAGIVLPNVVNFSINDKLNRLRDEFTYHAQAKGLELHVVPSTVAIQSDRRLLEQMIRNLLSNAVKYTNSGKVLLGCRRHKDVLSIEIWDTGIGIPDADLQTIFEEFHQIGNDARERARGLGLGLSIVQRLGNLLGHEILVRSKLGKGSVFSIEVKLAPAEAEPQPQPQVHPRSIDSGIVNGAQRTGAILIVEDDPEVRELLVLALKDEGHHPIAVPNGAAALEEIERGPMRPDLILADYNLPGAMNGVQMTATIREKLHRQIPVLILSGDISTSAVREIAFQHCVHLTKPVNLTQLSREIQRLLPPQPALVAQAHETTAADGQATIFLVDDDAHVRAGMRSVLEADGRLVEDYATCESFLKAYRPGGEACLLVDANLPGMGGIELLWRLSDAGHRMPSIMITGDGDVPMAVEAMKAGASDFIEKPINAAELLTSIDFVLGNWRDTHKLTAWREAAAAHVAGLTARQRQIMEMVLAGHPSKNIAADLGISQRTVENHRASIMKRTGSKSLPALARLALAAAQTGSDESAL